MTATPDLGGGWGTAYPREQWEPREPRELKEPAGGYVAQVSSSTLLESAYSSPFPMATRRLAEHAAAQAALEAEFPEVAQECRTEKAEPKGKKRKGINTVEDGPKTRLNNFLQVLLDRPCQKGDITYETQGDEDGPIIAWVCLPAWDPDQSWQGVPAEDQKQAERNAAEAACEALEDVVAPLAEERKAKKAKLAME